MGEKDERTRNVFKNNLQYYMAKEHITQTELAEKLGVSTATVSYWYNGLKYPRVDVMQQIAEALGVRIEMLIGQYEDIEEYNFVEKAVISAYRELSIEGKTYIQQQLEIARKLYKKEK